MDFIFIMLFYALSGKSKVPEEPDFFCWGILLAVCFLVVFFVHDGEKGRSFFND